MADNRRTVVLTNTNPNGKEISSTEIAPDQDLTPFAHKLMKLLEEYEVARSISVELLDGSVLTYDRPSHKGPHDNG